MTAYYLGNVARTTTSNTTIYVDITNGTDAIGQGKTSGTGAFKTPKYAVESLPRVIDHQVTIEIAAGTYTFTENSYTAFGDDGSGAESMIFPDAGSDAIDLSGFSGRGGIWLKGSGSGTCLFSLGAYQGRSLWIRNTTCAIVVSGIGFSRSVATKVGSGITLSGVSNFIIKSCSFRNFATGVETYLGSLGIVRACAFTDCAVAVQSGRACVVHVRDNSGSGMTNIYSAHAGIMMSTDPKPAGGAFSSGASGAIAINAKNNAW
jgi:hypothetical protein